MLFRNTFSGMFIFCSCFPKYPYFNKPAFIPNPGPVHDIACISAPKHPDKSSSRLPTAETTHMRSAGIHTDRWSKSSLTKSILHRLIPSFNSPEVEDPPDYSLFFSGISSLSALLHPEYAWSLHLVRPSLSDLHAFPASSPSNLFPSDFSVSSLFLVY